MLRVAIASAVAVVMASGVAFASPAATLSNVSGSVLVDNGKGFVKLSKAGDLQDGSRVLVSKGGKATLAYGDGCVKSLSPNSITTVGQAACVGSSQVAGQAPVVPASAFALTPAVIIGGVVVVGGIAAIAVGASDSGSNDIVIPPISQ